MQKARWVFGPLLIISGFLYLTGSFLGGVLVIIGGLVLTPPSGKIIFQKFSIENNKIAKYGTFLSTTFIGFALVTGGANKAASGDIEKVNDFIKQEKFTEALLFIEENQEKHSLADEFISLSFLIKEVTDLGAQQDSLTSMSDREFELLSNNTLQKEYYKSKELNEYFINQLYEIKDQRKQLLDQRKQLLAEKKAREVKASRKKMIEKQFSAWDGSHMAFKKLLKDGMDNPRSFEHVETQYIDKGETLQIITTYRGTNAFGGIVAQTNSAIYDLEGNLVQWVY